MTRRSWQRVVAALLVVTACSLTLPVKAAATSLTMDSVYAPVGKIFNRAMDWLLSLWKPPTGRRSPGINKFGAGQSSDGRASHRAGHGAGF
jgi:hypothetical protein